MAGTVGVRCSDSRMIVFYPADGNHPQVLDCSSYNAVMHY